MVPSLSHMVNYSSSVTGQLLDGFYQHNLRVELAPIFKRKEKGRGMKTSWRYPITPYSHYHILLFLCALELFKRVVCCSFPSTLCWNLSLKALTPLLLQDSSDQGH